MYSRILLLALCLLQVHTGTAQTWRKQADSLLQAYRNTPVPAAQTELLTRASLILLFQKPDTALTLSQEAVAIAERSKNDTLMTMAYASVSAVYVIKDDNPNTLAFALKGLSISERTLLPPDIMASLYRKTGYVYRNKKNYPASIAAYENSIAWSVKAGNRHDIAATQSNLGQIFALSQQYDSALFYHEAALRTARQEGFSDIVVRSYINIVNLYDMQNRFPQTLRAINEMEPWLEQPGVTPIVKGLAYTAIADKLLKNGNPQPQLAARYLDSMKRLMTTVDPGTENQVSYFLNRALYEYSLQHYDSAAAALANYHAKKELLDREIIDGHAQELNTRYETGKKEAQIKNLDAESRQRKKLLLLFASVAAVFLALLLMVWWQKKKIKKQEKKLAYLMKELHHRVKNNLQIVSSLLSIQQVKIEDVAAQKALQEGQHRVDAMSLIHKKLYQTDSVNSVNIGEYINELCEHLLHAYGHDRGDFNLQVSIAVKTLEPDLAVPLGLIINETVTNAMKYAYAGVAEPELRISLSAMENNLLLSVADNGTGLTEAQWKASRSFGRQLIQSLTAQLKGTVRLQTGNGTTFSFQVPLKQNRT